MDESEESRPAQRAQQLEVGAALGAVFALEQGPSMAADVSKLAGLIGGMQTQSFAENIGLGATFLESVATWRSELFAENVGLGSALLRDIAGWQSESIAESIGLGAAFLADIAAWQSDSVAESVGLAASLTESIGESVRLGLDSTFFDTITGLQKQTLGLASLGVPSLVSSAVLNIGAMVEVPESSFLSALHAVDGIDRAVQHAMKGVIAAAPRDALAQAIAALDSVDAAVVFAAAPLIPPSIEVERFEVAERVEAAIFAPRRRKRDYLARLVEIEEQRDRRDMARDAQDSVRFWVQVDIGLLAVVVGLLQIYLAR